MPPHHLLAFIVRARSGRTALNKLLDNWGNYQHALFGFDCITNTVFLRGWECDDRSIPIRAAKNNLDFWRNLVLCISGFVRMVKCYIIMVRIECLFNCGSLEGLIV
jgi:hypothetical protein